MMHKAVPVYVEPLSAQRWAKIERGLFLRLDSEAVVDELPAVPARRFWLRPAVAAALAGAVALALAVGLRRAEPAVGHQLSRITTGATASHLALPGFTVDVEPESTVVIGRASERGVLIVVDRGTIACSVAPRSADAPLIVQAGSAQVRVVGTRFRVTRSGEAARVAVEEGVVEVEAAGRVSRVAAGQVWPAAPADAASSLLAEPLGSARAEPAASGLAPREASRARAARPAAVGGTSSESESSTQRRFEQAARLERSDPARALALYRSIGSGADSWAQNAHFAQGRLEAARGSRAEARRVLTAYLARYPQGANADDARAVLERLR
jgi:FecR protein